MKDFAGATQGEVGYAFLLEGVAYTVTSLTAGLVSTNLPQIINFENPTKFKFSGHRQVQVSSGCVSDWERCYGFCLVVHCPSTSHKHRT